MLLMIDNYDSFTWNLVQYFAELGAEVKVVRNDEYTVAELLAMQPERVVISPGPCTPNEAGVSLEAIKAFAGLVPILGVCLGHQSIGQVFGGVGIFLDKAGKVFGPCYRIGHSAAQQGVVAFLPHLFCHQR